MLEAAVFDMDGLMIDSQPYWQTAQLEILSTLGVPITRQDTLQTTGMRVDEIVQLCYDTSPWDSVSREEVCQAIVDRVIELVNQHKPAMPGLEHAIEVFRKRGVRLAIASSSPLSLITATIEALKLDGVFEVKMSGAELPYAKPHPAVYLNVCNALGVQPTRAVALEDSFIGLLAAKSAQMKTIVIPESTVANDQRFLIADRQLNSLQEISDQLLESL
ncbi:hexitol phosphatase HxpB [Aureliella helgolandensis]|uniref:2-deoxyglucose-6-phosphate phosphatase n=1 Tax=Aureliella helgolandensis TaxID=2527968 RepID=A0A518GCR8_9BACT|nr:hexitol phosphatase HxpB [Aureliella helgolandensis]QDV26392.1 2-deoxyglucose-6-phosphate phosphatase [Aureliella helgolandensis]